MTLRERVAEALAGEYGRKGLPLSFGEMADAAIAVVAADRKEMLSVLQDLVAIGSVGHDRGCLYEPGIMGVSPESDFCTCAISDRRLMRKRARAILAHEAGQ